MLSDASCHHVMVKAISYSLRFVFLKFPALQRPVHTQLDRAPIGPIASDWDQARHVHARASLQICLSNHVHTCMKTDMHTQVHQRVYIHIAYSEIE